MKKVIWICLLFIFSIEIGNCASVYFPPLQPIDGNNLAPSNTNGLNDTFAANNPNESGIINYPKINEIERSLFGSVYSNQEIVARLSRIEKSLFNTTYPNSALSQRVENIIMNYNQINRYPNISKNELSKIESKVFGRNYAQNDPQIRIERLEQELLGAVQEGELESRLQTIKIASRGINSINKDDYYQNPIAGGQRGLRGILGTLGSMFFGSGTLTGFTPQIDPFYNSAGGYGYNNFAGMGTNPGYGMNPGSGMYSGTRSNFGYSDQYRDYGTGSRVTILD